MRLLPLLLPIFVLGCAVKGRSVKPPPLQPMAAAPDNRASEAYSRCDAELRAQPAIAQAHRNEAVNALLQQRLVLLTALETNKAQAKTLSARRRKAQKSMHDHAQSEYERALVAEALLNLDNGQEPERPLPNRIRAREEFRDAVEVQHLIRRNQETAAKIEAQITALDSLLRQIKEGNYPNSVLPPAPVASAATGATKLALRH